MWYDIPGKVVRSCYQFRICEDMEQRKDECMLPLFFKQDDQPPEEPEPDDAG